MGFQGTEEEALKVVKAYAACQIVGGCDMCPIYKETREDKNRQQEKCQNAITAQKVREALTLLARTDR